MATTCWEFEKCEKRDICPAYPGNGFDCWTIGGTLCRDKHQGQYEEKIGDCRNGCAYYHGVMSGQISIT